MILKNNTLCKQAVFMMRIQRLFNIRISNNVGLISLDLKVFNFHFIRS